MDFAQVVNFYAVQSGKIIAEKELKRLAEEKQKQLEKERLEKERIMKEQAFEAKLEKDRRRLQLEEEKRAKAEEFKNKIAESKKKKEAATEASKLAHSQKEKSLIPLKKSLKTRLQKNSPCHESREKMDTIYCNLFRIIQ